MPSTPKLPGTNSKRRPSRTTVLVEAGSVRDAETHTIQNFNPDEIFCITRVKKPGTPQFRVQYLPKV